MLIEIKEMHPAGPGKKMAAIVAATGQRYSIWPEQLAKLKVGATFDADVESWESNGRTLQKITKFAPVNDAATNGASAPATGNGAAKANGHVPAPAVPTVAETAFVGRALHALILKGDVTYDKRSLYDAVTLLRGLYGATFGKEEQS
jgi:hypothetical protein